MRIAVLFPTLVLLLLLSVGCVMGPTIPRSQLDGWSVVNVAQVRLFGDVAQDELQRFADDLALFDASFARLAGWSPTSGAVPVSVFLMRERELARRFGLGGGIAGWAHPTLGGAYSVVAVRANHVSTRSTLFHEYTHVLLRRERRAPLPPWYDEGLASFFSTLAGRDGAVVVGAPPSAAVARVAERGPLPLAELFEGDIWGRDAQGVADFYATSWALSHYLLLTPKGRREMSRFVAQLSRGEPPEQAQRVAFGRSPEALESELRRHVALLARGVPAEVVFDLETLDIREPGRAASLPRAEVAGELGLLALQLGTVGGRAAERALAARLLKMAASKGAPTPRAEAALAEALALSGDAREATIRLQGALARASDDPRVRLHAGRVELALAEGNAAPGALESAEAHFRRVVALDRRSAPGWFGLGRTLQRAARPDEALAALQKARSLGWSPALDLALGELELQGGHTQQALALLWPLVQDLHGGTATDEASRLLKQAGLLPGEATGTEP